MGGVLGTRVLPKHFIITKSFFFFFYPLNPRNTLSFQKTHTNGGGASFENLSNVPLGYIASIPPPMDFLDMWLQTLKP